jgi:uncharacterized protein YndB with AHSA1/START domain
MAIRQTIDLGCPPDAAFKAFTDPDAIRCWWGDDESYRVSEWQAELRPGGKWRARFKTASGESFGASGEYLAIDAPRLVEWSWRSDWENTDKRLRMEFQPMGSGTCLRAMSEAEYNEEMEADDRRGLSEILSWFARYCDAAK